MNWSDVLADPSLQDLPYKIETNAYGQIVMSPASNNHGDTQALIAKLLDQYLSEGRSSIENSIATSDGVKVADVTWRSREFLTRHGGESPFTSAPEICVEVLSPSNSPDEIDHKRRLYLEAGASEVWVCQEDGTMRFDDAAGRLQASRLAPEFPKAITLDD